MLFMSWVGLSLPQMTRPNHISVYSSGDRFPDRILPFLSIHWEYGEFGLRIPPATADRVACRCPPSRYLQQFRRPLWTSGLAMDVRKYHHYPAPCEADCRSLME